MTLTRLIYFQLLVVALNSISSALEARKVLNIPEKIIGGVIDIVQNHKNKPAQQTTAQSQAQQQVYQGYPQQYAPWNTGYQTGQTQAQYQGQYGNYVYPQTGNSYPQGSYVNTQTYPSGQQYGGQYQTYPQNSQSGNQFQVQNQQNTGSFEGQQASQFQSQVQTGVHGQGQQAQVQVQNQQLQNQNQQAGQFVNQNQHTNFQGSQQVVNQQNYQNQPSGSFVTQTQPTGTYVGHQQSNNFASNQQTQNFAGSQGSHNFASNQQSSNFVGQTQPTHNYVLGQNKPHGQVPQPVFVGQHQQTSQLQGQSGNQSFGPGPSGSNNGGFQISTGHNSGAPGPTCVCQAWTKPQNGVLNDTPSQRSEEKAEKPELSS